MPGGTESEPTFCAYDRDLRPRLELAADLGRGYGARGGVEFPAAVLRVLRAWDGTGVAQRFDPRGERLVLPPRH